MSNANTSLNRGTQQGMRNDFAIAVLLPWEAAVGGRCRKSHFTGCSGVPCHGSLKSCCMYNLILSARRKLNHKIEIAGTPDTNFSDGLSFRITFTTRLIVPIYLFLQTNENAPCFILYMAGK